MVPKRTVDVIFSSKRAPVSFVIFKKMSKISIYLTLKVKRTSNNGQN